MDVCILSVVELWRRLPVQLVVVVSVVVRSVCRDHWEEERRGGQTDSWLGAIKSRQLGALSQRRAEFGV